MREQLASRSITITLAESREGTRITFPVDASQALLEEIIPLLEAVAPVVELDLSGTKVTTLPLLSFSPICKNSA